MLLVILLQKKVYYIDNKTNNVKNGTHELFDEDHFTVDSEHTPIAANAFQRLSYANYDNQFKDCIFYTRRNTKSKKAISKFKNSSSINIAID